jgi:hypothetical protein
MFNFPFFLPYMIRYKTDNSFRLPFGWQYMVGNNQASTSLDPTFLGKYDTLVQGVLKSGDTLCSIPIITRGGMEGL